jgi:hypothetical protein
MACTMKWFPNLSLWLTFLVMTYSRAGGGVNFVWEV